MKTGDWALFVGIAPRDAARRAMPSLIYHAGPNATWTGGAGTAFWNTAGIGPSPNPKFIPKVHINSYTTHATYLPFSPQ